MPEDEQLEHSTQRDEGTAVPGPSAPGATDDYLPPEVERRVSSILQAVLDAVEREADELRRQAREESRRYVEESKRRAEGLVAERQRRIAELSDALTARADRVLRHLEDAERVRAAFDDLVRGLGETAERLARETSDYSEFEPPAFSESMANVPRHPPDQHGAWAKPSTPPAAGPAPSTPPPTPREAEAPQVPPQTASPFVPDAPFPPDRPPPTGPGGERQPSGSPWQNLDGAQMVAIHMAAAGSIRAEVESHLRDSLGVANPARILDEVFGPGSPPGARVPWARPPTN